MQINTCQCIYLVISNNYHIQIRIISKADTRPGSPHPSCNIYATIKEDASGARVTVCSGEMRHRHLYTSASNSVEIQIANTVDDGGEPAYFAIAFQGNTCYILSIIHTHQIISLTNLMWTCANSTSQFEYAHIDPLKFTLHFAVIIGLVAYD